MLVIYRDPKGLLGRDIVEIDNSLTLQENIQRAFPDGLSADTTTVIVNGKTVNPLEFDLNKPASKDDAVTIMLRQQGITLAIVGIIAAAAAIAVIALTPKPTIPNQSGSRKDSPNNELTGQTNLARLYQAIPDIYGKVRVFPDLVSTSLSEYIDNIKHVTELLCVGVGSYEIEKVKYSDTLLSTISGASYEVFYPGNVIPEIYDVAESPDVDGQEITPPNRGDTVLYSATTNNARAAYSQSELVIELPTIGSLDYFFDKSKPISVKVDIVLTNNSYTVSGQIYKTELIGEDGATTNRIYINKISSQSSLPVFNSQVRSLTISDMEALYVGPFILPSESDQIWYNVVFLRGLMDDDGDNATAEFTAEWWQVDEDNNQIPGTSQSESFSYNDSTYNALYFTRKVTPSGGRARYAFRIQRTNNGYDQLTDQAKLEEVYSVQIRRNVTAQETLIRCVTIATAQATGYKDKKFNALATRLTVSWDGSKVVTTLRASRSFADAVLHCYTQVAKRSYTELDLVSLYAIDAALKAKNERLGWFDFSFDDEDISLGERLQTICNVARVTVFRDGLMWRFVRDEKKSIISAQFDSRNLASGDSGGSLQYKCSLPTSYDGVELEWVDSTDTNQDGTDKKAYIRLRINAASKSIVAGTARRPYKMQLAGCRNRDQAQNRAQLEARRIIYQRIAVEDVALNDAFLVQLGDRARWLDSYDSVVTTGEIIQIAGSTFYTSESLGLRSDTTYKVSITDRYGYPSAWLTASYIAGKPTAFSAVYSNAYVADDVTVLSGSRFVITTSLAGEPMEFTLTARGPASDPDTLSISLTQYDERTYGYD
ncbi:MULTISPECIES: host specificity factor TipJ family phage tail protein [Enterobacterales]|uniref:host specificity factor TipJ family phage tail protein n=1 Tax=Enterobacterales TaxID=91347 RepID=UPI002ED7BAFF